MSENCSTLGRWEIKKEKNPEGAYEHENGPFSFIAVGNVPPPPRSVTSKFTRKLSH
jgi:hypothetical protein